VYFIALLHHLIQLRSVLNFRLVAPAGIHDRLRSGSKGMLGNKTFRRWAEGPAIFAIVTIVDS